MSAFFCAIEYGLMTRIIFQSMIFLLSETKKNVAWLHEYKGKIMNITIRQKDIEVTEPLREYIWAKLVRPVEKLTKRMRLEGAPMDIEVARTTNHHHKGGVYRVAVGLTLGGKLIRAEADDSDVHAACDTVEDELKREIVHYKTRSQSIIKRVGRRTKEFFRFDPSAHFRRKGRDWGE